MNTLDFGAIMERDGWYEDYDLTCPFCQDGKKDYEALTPEEKKEVALQYAKAEAEERYQNWCTLNGHWDDPETECPDKPELWDEFCDDFIEQDEVIDWYEDNRGDLDYDCDECTDGNVDMDVVWNTAFEVDLPYSCSSGSAYQDMRRLTLSLGFLLIEQGGRHYLVMLSCGQDNTWRIHYTRWLLQDKFLELGDCEACLSNWGAHVFLHGEAKKEFLAYLEDRVLGDPSAMLSSLSWRGEDVARVRSKYLTGSKEDKEMPQRTFTIQVAKVVLEEREATGRTAAEALSDLRSKLRDGYVPIRVLDPDEPQEG